MAKKCIQCGRDNDDSSPKCVCGSDLPEAGAIAPAATPATASGAPAPAPTDGRKLGLRKIVFVLWMIAFVPLFAALRSHLHLPPLYRCLVGTAVFCAPAVAALWLLGREKQRMLFAWRIFFLLWLILLSPLLLTIVDGIAEQGWPSGRHNKPIAHLLILDLTLAVPAFLTAVCALLRTYRLASVLALVAGLVSVVDGYYLIRATAPSKGWSFNLVDILDIVLFGTKVASRIAIPIGIALIIGGILTFRAARAARRVPAR